MIEETAEVGFPALCHFYVSPLFPTCPLLSFLYSPGNVIPGFITAQPMWVPLPEL